MKKLIKINYKLNDIIVKVDKKNSNIFFIFLDNVFLFAINTDDSRIDFNSKLSNSNNKYLILCSIPRPRGLQYSLKEYKNIIKF